MIRQSYPGDLGDRLRCFWRVSLKQGIYFRIFLSKAESGFQVLSGSPIPKYWSGKKKNTTVVINILNLLIFINLTSRMLTQLMLNVKFIRMSKLNMFIIALCVLFLIKLRWPKNAASSHKNSQGYLPGN